MKELIIKDNLLIEELEKLDIYYSKNLDELMKYDNKIIIKLIDNIDSTLGYSLLKIDLEKFFCDELIGIQYLFNEEKILVQLSVPYIFTMSLKTLGSRDTI